MKAVSEPTRGDGRPRPSISVAYIVRMCVHRSLSFPHVQPKRSPFSHVLRSLPKRARKTDLAERVSVWAGERIPPFTAFSPTFIPEEHGHKTIFRVFPHTATPLCVRIYRSTPRLVSNGQFPPFSALPSKPTPHHTARRLLPLNPPQPL